ncbi:MAG: hypothetical protein K0M45_02285 [Candidatus Paracaedibacteraceae bacterium]|nr:hypothetical protein [Candidatus Paracaedibacteraceae bacterium]
MFKILSLVGLIILQGHAQELECKYRKLKGHTQTYAGKIIEEIPTTVDNIQKDLDFLSTRENKSNILSQYKDENFDALKQATLGVSPYDEILQNFVRNCNSIYKFNKKNSCIRKSVYMLLYDVTAELIKYFEADENILKNLNANSKV